MAKDGMNSSNCFDDNFDPFATANETNGNLETQAIADEQSKQYLAALELKLSRLKGRKQPGTAANLNSKDMLKTLHQAKEDTIKRLTANDTPLVTDTILDSREDVEISDLKRKMFPEQPLNAEEIQCLTERDYLGTVVHNLQQVPKETDEVADAS